MLTDCHMKSRSHIGALQQYLYYVNNDPNSNIQILSMNFQMKWSFKRVLINRNR